VRTSARTPVESGGGVGWGTAVVTDGSGVDGAVVDTGVVPDVVATASDAVGAGEITGWDVSVGVRVSGEVSRTVAEVGPVVAEDRPDGVVGVWGSLGTGALPHPETSERERKRQTAAALTHKA